MIQFPLIMQFARSFKDDANIYFLTEYIRGMELGRIIYRDDVEELDTEECRFYVASLLLCVEYLHSHKIIHRDIKPENVIIDDKGNFKLLDLGAAKIQDQNRCLTQVGTPWYTAPEIIENKGYSFPVDLWSIGICFFEFLFGYLPFGDDQDDPYEIYKEILTGTFEIPEEMEDVLAKDLLRKLLRKEPGIRFNGSYA